VAIPRVNGAEQIALARLLDQIAAILLDRRTVPGGTEGRAQLDGYLSGVLEGLAAELRGDDGRRLQHELLERRTARLPAYVAELAPEPQHRHSSHAEREAARPAGNSGSR
jgi:hypothetical protein